MALSNPNFDGELSMTIAAWMAANFADMISGNNPAFMKMRAKGSFKKGGQGTKYAYPIMFPTLTGPQVEDISNPYDDVVAGMSDNRTMLEYIRCEKEIDISVPLYNMENQGSDTQKISLVESETKIAMAKFDENLNANFWAAPEGAQTVGTRTRLGSIRQFINAATATSTDGGCTPSALPSQVGALGIVGATGTTAQYVVGGVNRNAAGAAYLNSNVFVTSDTLTIQILSKPYSATIRSKDHCDLILMHPDSFDKLMNLATLGGANGGKFFSESAMANLGYDAIRFRGADIVADQNVPTAGFKTATATALNYQIFYLNTEYLELKYTSMDPAIRQVPEARPIKRWRGRWTGQFCASNPGRLQALHANITN